MTLEELKTATLKIIEEYSEDATSFTDDEDIEAKMPDCINMILHELARFKKIPAHITEEVEEDDVLMVDSLDNFYQLNIIRGVEYERIEDMVTFKEKGTANIYYYKYPTTINEDTSDDFELELDEDALNIAPFGIAAELLKVDPSNQYGDRFYSRYMNMLQALDSRKSMPTITIEDIGYGIL